MGRFYKLAMVSAAFIGINHSQDLLSQNSSIFEEPNGVTVLKGDTSEKLNGKGEKIQKSVPLAEEAGIPQEVRETWSTYSKNTAYTTASYVGGKVLENVDYCARYVVAWNMNHLMVDTLEEVTANIAWGAATFAAGPAAGTGAYYTAKGVLKTLRYVVPGFEGYISGMYAPVTKSLIVDPVISCAPSLITGVGKAGIAGSKGAYQAAKYFYNWARG